MSANTYNPAPECSLSRDASLPDYAQYDGLVGRLCDFLGIGTGSTRGDYEALRKLLQDKMNQCAAVHECPVNSRMVYGKGQLGFGIDEDLIDRNETAAVEKKENRKTAEEPEQGVLL